MRRELLKKTTIYFQSNWEEIQLRALELTGKRQDLVRSLAKFIKSVEGEMEWKNEMCHNVRIFRGPYFKNIRYMLISRILACRFMVKFLKGEKASQRLVAWLSLVLLTCLKRLKCIQIFLPFLFSFPSEIILECMQIADLDEPIKQVLLTCKQYK